jgi:hypothetical protein
MLDMTEGQCLVLGPGYLLATMHSYLLWNLALHVPMILLSLNMHSLGCLYIVANPVNDEMTPGGQPCDCLC